MTAEEIQSAEMRLLSSDRRENMKLVCFISAVALLCSTSAVAAQKTAVLGRPIETSLGSRHATVNLGLQGESVPVLLTLLKCSDTAPRTFLCDFSFKLNTDKDSKLGLQRSDFFVVFNNGATAKATGLTVSNTIEVPERDERALEVFPGVSYPLTVKFEGTSMTVKDIKYLDIGWKGDQYHASDWVRYESVVPPVARAPLTSFPTPQPALTPGQYLTLDASAGYGNLSGVSLNGGLYDVNLLGCRAASNGMADCTMTLTPMRAPAQRVTLEDLNVSVKGSAVVATATAIPTVMTLVISAPVDADHIDVLQLGNARFLNVGIR